MDNKIYYVYEWIRLDTNEPFYVGKGHGDRCYRYKNRNPYFLNICNKFPCAVFILHNNLTEEEAFAYECDYIYQYIFEYGYKLCNMTYGGEGVAGYKPSEENIKKYRMKYHGFDIEDYKDKIIDMYTHKELTTYEIGKYYGVSDVCIARVLKKFSVNLRRGGSIPNKHTGLSRYNAKCILVKDTDNNIINCFESLSLCGKWLVDIGLVNKPSGGNKAIRTNVETNKIYKGLLFYYIDKQQYANLIKNKHQFSVFIVNNITMKSMAYVSVVDAC